MRLLVFFLVLSAGYVRAQDISGSWHGALDINGIKLRLVLHIAEEGQGYTGKLDSPDQGAKGIPVGSVEFADGRLNVQAPAIGAAYEGALEADTVLDGVFSQGGQRFPLRLVRRDKGGIPETERPQEPKPPFPYESQEVSFENKEAGVTLAGTLTWPKSAGPHPAVILLTGSGPQNRDEELFGHKPFLVIADYLTRHGLAVLRYDDRGVGGSTGNFAASTSADFASDAAAAFAFLKTQDGIDPVHIGLLGHSEGGMLAPMVAAAHDDVAFLVLLAAPGIPIDSLLLTQSELISKASGVPALQLAINRQLNAQVYELVKTDQGGEALGGEIRTRLSPAFDQAVAMGAMTQEQAAQSIDQQITTLTSPWMRYFLTFEPEPYLRQVKCPVLALNGSNDLQVAAGPNLAGIARVLKASGNTRVTVKELAGLNHLFQESNTGLPAEYGTITQTIAPGVLEEIRSWLLAIMAANYR